MLKNNNYMRIKWNNIKVFLIKLVTKIYILLLKVFCKQENGLNEREASCKNKLCLFSCRMYNKSKDKMLYNI